MAKGKLDIERRRIDEIIIAIPSADRKVINEVYSKCEESGCKVKILPSVSELIDESVIIQKIREVSIEDLPSRGNQVFYDYSGSCTACIAGWSYGQRR